MNSTYCGLCGGLHKTGACARTSVDLGREEGYWTPERLAEHARRQRDQQMASDLAEERLQRRARPARRRVGGL